MVIFLFNSSFLFSFQKALGQQFKKEVHIRNLPSLFKKPKPEKRDILDNSETGCLAALFSPQQDDI